MSEKRDYVKATLCINKEFNEKLKELCARKGTCKSELTLKLLEQWYAENIDR